MREVTVLAVGKVKSRELAVLQRQYSDRLRPFCRLDLVEIRDSDPQREGERLLEFLRRRSARVVALTEEGVGWSSHMLAKELEGHEGDWLFIVGGPFGLSPAVKDAANICLSLSPMTFPHELARVVFLEQLYRAHSILAGSGYHH